MILRDIEIKALVDEKQLIQNFEPVELSNCRYNLRAGRAFSPATGAEQVISESPRWRRKFQRHLGWEIKPAETLIVMTTESICMPPEIMATYGQLNRLAQRGVSLINTSIVEPGYKGPLSCFLVNFSRETVYIYPGDAVAKMCFFRLTGAPDKLRRQEVTTDQYERVLRESAQRYPISLLDISGLEERVSDRVTKSVNRSITLGGVVVVFLIAWATLEPVISRWLWERIGVVTTTQREEFVRMQNALATAEAELRDAKKALEAEENLLKLQQQLNSTSDRPKAPIK
jgi:deoxycytidine triphosphate deaminase